jgi:hypothetical protein
VEIPGYCGLIALMIQRTMEADAVSDPIDPSPSLPLVVGGVNGEVALTLIDSGATHPYIEAELARKAGLCEDLIPMTTSIASAGGPVCALGYTKNPVTFSIGHLAMDIRFIVA